MPHLFRIAFLAVTILFSIGKICAQEELMPIKGTYIGVGLGLDAGGMGARATYWPAPYIGGFVGAGWAAVAMGFTAGIELRAPTGHRVSPFLSGMYGYNGSIRVIGREELNRIYNGPTIGLGLILQQRYIRNHWRFSINFPIRSEEMLDDVRDLKNRSSVIMLSDLPPFTLGIGFHFGV